jgi:hypothetical protein
MTTKRFHNSPQLTALADSIIVPAEAIDGGTDTAGNPVAAGVDIKIPLAQLISYILAGGDPSLPWFAAAYDSAATDHAPAINAAITSAAAVGGGVVFCRRGIWTLSTAPGGASNSQIVLPSIALSTAQIAIEIRGEIFATPVFSVIGSIPLPAGGTVFKSTATGTGGKVIGAATPADSYPFTLVTLGLKNVTIQLVHDTGHTAVDASNFVGLDVDGVVIHTGQYNLSALTEPTNPVNYALKVPANSNGAYTRIGTLAICGYYNGMTVAEHTCGDMVSVWGCRNAFMVQASNHASHFNRVMTVWCQKGFVGLGAHTLTVDQFDTEHASSGWWVDLADIDDGNDYLRGNVRWHAVLAGTGPSTAFVVAGGANLDVQRIGVRAENVQAVNAVAAVAPLAKTDLLSITGQAVDLTINNPPAAPADGHGIVIRIRDNGTAHGIGYGTQYRAIEITLPVATTPGKWTYIAGAWNAIDGVYDMLATRTQA